MKIAIFGLGNFGTRWLERVLSYDQDCFVYCISRKTHKKITNLNILDNLNRFKFINTFPDESFDLSIICTPAISEDRKHLIYQIANRSKFLLVEKPISDSYDASKVIVNYINKSKCKFMVGYQYRFHDLVVNCQQKIARDINIKTIKITHHTNMANWHPNKDYTRSISSDIKKAGGCLNELSHSIDLIEALLPKWKIKVITSEQRFQSSLNLKDGTDAAYSLKLIMTKNSRTIDVYVEVSFDSDQESRTIELIHENGGTCIDLISNIVTPMCSDFKKVVPNYSQYNEIMLTKELCFAYSVLNTNDSFYTKNLHLISNGLFAAKISEIVRGRSID